VTELGDQQAADGGEAERAAGFRSGAQPRAIGIVPASGGAGLIMMGENRTRHAS